MDVHSSPVSFIGRRINFATKYRDFNFEQFFVDYTNKVRGDYYFFFIDKKPDVSRVT